MSMTLTNVGISDITRYQSDEQGGTVTANVRLNFNEGESISHQLGLAVDLEDAGGMTFEEIEAAALREAARVIAMAASIDADTMAAKFRALFEKQ